MEVLTRVLKRLLGRRTRFVVSVDALLLSFRGLCCCLGKLRRGIANLFADFLGRFADFGQQRIVVQSIGSVLNLAKLLLCGRELFLALGDLTLVSCVVGLGNQGMTDICGLLRQLLQVVD